MNTPMLRTLLCAAVVALVPAAGRSLDPVSNRAEVPFARTLSGPSGDDVQLAAVVDVQADVVGSAAGGARVTATCRVNDAGTRAANGSAVLVLPSDAPQQANVAGPLPSDFSLACRARLVRGGSDAPQDLWVRVNGTVFPDGSIVFAVDGVTVE